MDADERESRRLSRVLRHRRDVPHDESGWFLVEDAARASGLSADRVRKVAEGNHLHGHSNGVIYTDEADHPDILYHGTSVKGYEGILASGAILPMGRDAVHLSTTAGYAYDVGRRRGTPVILRVDAGRMCADGFVFHISGDGVYLVDRVPAEYITRTESGCDGLEQSIGQFRTSP